MIFSDFLRVSETSRRHDSPVRRGSHSIFSLMSLVHTSGYNFRGETSGKIQRDILERFWTNKAMLFSTPYLKSRLSIVFSMQITANSLQRVYGFHVLVTVFVMIFDQDYFLDFIQGHPTTVFWEMI